jgi:hypothetical protein
MTQATDWKTERDAELAQLAEAAYDLLVDRTVAHVTAVPHDDDCDSPNVLRLTLDDGSVIDITGGYGGYGGYSGQSCDEYVEQISIDRVP